MLDIKEEKDKIAIVVVGYNRLRSLTRLLDSLNSAEYTSNDVPLIISIDASENEDLYRYVEEYEWHHGVKYVNIEKNRLGLKNHILQCGDLTKFFKAIALFEDDIYVSPCFYNYLIQVVDKYGNDERICEISLYRNEIVGRRGFYFDVLHDGTDFFLWQDVSTWGECWTNQMWNGFREWLNNHDDNYINQMDIPDFVKGWTRAWSKYYIAYVVDTNKYVLFPHISVTTNFNDAGGEHGGGNNAVQVNLLQGNRSYIFPEIGNIIRYDIYTNNLKIYEWLPEKYRDDTCLDIYGFRTSFYGKRYVLSLKKMPYRVVKEWGVKMRPVELNLLYKIPGKGLSLYDSYQKKNFCWTLNSYSTPIIGYFLRGFNVKYLILYTFKEFVKSVCGKFKFKLW